MGHIIVTVETAAGPAPYGTERFPYGRLIGEVTGPKALVTLFDRALARSQRRIAERARAMTYSRPRYRAPAERLTADSPVPNGWHLAGTCPDCTEAS